MATIACPDCKNDVSEMAEVCPYCARPKPYLPPYELDSEREQFERNRHVEALANIEATKQQEKNKSEGIWGLLWLGHALVVWAKLGFWWGVSSLLFGPFVWFFHWVANPRY